MKLTNYQGNIEHDVVERSEIEDILSNVKPTTAREALFTSSGWVASGSIFSQTVTVNGMTEGDNPVVGLDIDKSITDSEVIAAKQSAFSLIYAGETALNSVTLYATAQPTEDLNILFVGCQQEIDSSADLNGLKIAAKTQSEYDAIGTKDPSTIYFIYEE